MNAKSKRTLLVCVILVIVTATAIASFNLGQGVKQDKPHANQKRIPKEKVYDVAPKPQGEHERAVREAKNQRYDRDGTDYDLTELTPGTAVVHGVESPIPAFIPISQSDVTIIGTVTNIQPYLSKNRKNLYTEFTTNVEEVIKNESNIALAVGGSVVFDWIGGALRLPNGRIAQFTTNRWVQKPIVDGRYVLFLKSSNEGKALLIVRAYELRDSRIFPLDVITDEVNPFGGAEEDAFLSDVRTAASKK